MTDFQLRQNSNHPKCQLMHMKALFLKPLYDKETLKHGKTLIFFQSQYSHFYTKSFLYFYHSDDFTNLQWCEEQSKIIKSSAEKYFSKIKMRHGVLLQRSMHYLGNQ